MIEGASRTLASLTLASDYFCCSRDLSVRIQPSACVTPCTIFGSRSILFRGTKVRSFSRRDCALLCMRETSRLYVEQSADVLRLAAGLLDAVHGSGDTDRRLEVSFLSPCLLGVRDSVLFGDFASPVRGETVTDGRPCDRSVSIAGGCSSGLCAECTQFRPFFRASKLL